MASRFNRGRSPGRARDASQLSGSFAAGHKKLGGRKKGTRNLISPEHKWALLEAAHRVGSDVDLPRFCGEVRSWDQSI